MMRARQIMRGFVRDWQSSMRDGRADGLSAPRVALTLLLMNAACLVAFPREYIDELYEDGEG